MKKFFSILSILFTAFILIACTENVPSNVEFKSVNYKNNVYEAQLHISLAIDTLDDLKEVVHSSVNQMYQHQKVEFGLKTVTIYISVHLNDNTHVGDISFKVNQSIDKPGLTYINDNLKLT